MLLQFNADFTLRNHNGLKKKFNLKTFETFLQPIGNEKVPQRNKDKNSDCYQDFANNYFDEKAIYYEHLTRPLNK